jgi:hypothetical protein
VGRIRTGWRLAGESWRVLRGDRTLAIFPVLSFIFAAIAFALLIAPGVAVAAATDKDWALIPFALIASYGATFISIYFSVALAGAASISLQGGDATREDGMAVARERRGQIARWSVVQWAFGLLINAIQSLLSEGGVGAIVTSVITGLLGAAWSIATFFIVPVIALEGLGPKDSFKRSIELIRQRWGEGVVGSASIGIAIFFIVLIPLAALGFLGISTVSDSPELGVPALAIAAVIAIAAIVVGSALNVIFRVALYRYATEGHAAGFSDADLGAAFAPRKRRRG